jgi:hypothetical protein
VLQYLCRPPRRSCARTVLAVAGAFVSVTLLYCQLACFYAGKQRSGQVASHRQTKCYPLLSLTFS